MTHPKPGDFGLSTIGGTIGWWVNLEQALIGDPSRFTHAFVVLDDETVVEAMPGGAKIFPLEKYLDGKPIFSPFDLTDTERKNIVQHARSFIGVPYSFIDYMWLAFDHWGFKPTWLKNKIKSSGHMICSQLVDEAYLRAEVHLFDDGRDPGDVTPGDLLYAILLWKTTHREEGK